MRDTPDFCRHGCYWDCDHKPPPFVANKHKPLQRLTYAEYQEMLAIEARTVHERLLGTKP